MNDIMARLSAALRDRYLPEHELGSGGMATVYLAEDLKHQRKVAVKVLRPELAAVIGAERFLKEIKTTANLQHPHILGLIDSGQADGLLWYAMPFVGGESLRDRLRHEKQLPIPEAVRIATEVASALDYAHRHGVIHRDIKPENILLHDGSALVADFGIALAASTAGTRMTETGMSLGTPQYMSPEQAMGEREITARSDVYALGCVLYEMLVGDPPFTGSTAQAIVAKVVTEKPHSLIAQRHTVPPNLEAAVLTALEKLPADRFASAKELAEALADKGYAASSARPAAVRGIRRVLPWALLGVAVLGMAFLAVLGSRKTRTEAPGDVVRSVLELPAGATLNGGYLVLARDGSRLVVMGRQKSGTILLERALDQLAFVPVTGSDGGIWPFFSLDGKSLGFRRGQTIFKAPLDGGPPVEIATGTWQGGDWGGDGAIVYTRDYRSGLWRIPATGGTPTRVTSPDSAGGELGHWWPQILPDGDHVLFTAFRSPIERATIEMVSLSTGKRTPLLTGGLSAHYVKPGYLLFGRNEAIYAVPFDLRHLKVTGQPVVVVQDVYLGLAEGRAGFDVSDNGTLAYIAASTLNPDLDLVWVDRHGEAGASITAPTRFYDPVIGPGGHLVALGIAKPGEAKDVWVLDLARGTRTALTVGGANDFAPLFMRDGKRVVFESERPVFNLFTRAADASSPATPLVISPFDKYPASISPDGTLLFFDHHLLPHTEIWTVPLTEGGKPSSLLRSDAADLAVPRISPNGRWLAYTSNESGRSEIILSPYPAVTSTRRQVSAEGGHDPRWSRGGRELVYRNGNQMMAVAVDPVTGQLGTPVELFRGPFEDPAVGHSYDVTPDGERFLMLRRPTGAEPRQVVIVTNWFKELRRLVPKS